MTAQPASKFFFGLHYDLHAHAKDTQLGSRCTPRELMPLIRLMGPDFVQTDCKGHAGYTSWFSKVPTASVPPGLKKDALKQWREATRRLRLPLHCHYSGIWDKAAGTKYPEWSVRPGGEVPKGGTPVRELMCPRGPYLEKLMIPQLLELIDRYQVDGFWMDGDIWGVAPCYCRRCRAAFTKATGIKNPPQKLAHPDWPAWWNFTRESFDSYVTAYCDAVHRHKPGVRVCSNWLQTFRNPGEPKVPTDWISGDNTWVYALDDSRCEARFLSTRKKPWDIMLWNFYCSHGMAPKDSPWNAKPAQMLMQEAAVLVSFGGGVEIYETSSIRDGRLIEWRQRGMGEVGRFLKQRRKLCQNSETLPQIAVLHSENHVRKLGAGRSIMWGQNIEPVQGAVFALLENHFGVDILDEWALLPRLSEFPAIFVPERHAMSQIMVEALKAYVEKGGRLILTGAELFERFGGDFLGSKSVSVKKEAVFHLPAQKSSVPLYSGTWRMIRPTTALPLDFLGSTPLLDQELLPYPAAVVNKVGRGRVAYIPAAICHDFNHNRYPVTRAFIGDVVRRTVGTFPISVKAPLCIDAVFRRQGNHVIIHLINRSSGIPNRPNNGVIDDIPEVGPVVVTVRTRRPPVSVKAAWEGQPLSSKHRGNTLQIILPKIHIHEAIVIRCR